MKNTVILSGRTFPRGHGRAASFCCWLLLLLLLRVLLNYKKKINKIYKLKMN